jgi:hypothetical protein
MKKQLSADNIPIHELLKRLGYKFVGSCEDRSAKAEFKWRTPQGTIRRMKYQKRSGDGGPHGRYLIGIAYLRFDEVDDFVFWAEGERHLLIVPTKRLKSIFETHEFSLKKTDTQWHVNVSFNVGGLQTLHPVYCECENVSEFAHPI